MLSVILTFVPRQHVLKLNKHGNVYKSPPMKYLFLNSLAGKEVFLWKIGTSVSSWAHKSNGWWAHELISLRECSSNIYVSFLQDENKYHFIKKNIFFRAGQVTYLEKLRSDRLCYWSWHQCNINIYISFIQDEDRIRHISKLSRLPT